MTLFSGTNLTCVLHLDLSTGPDRSEMAVVSKQMVTKHTTETWAGDFLLLCTVLQQSQRDISISVYSVDMYSANTPVCISENLWRQLLVRYIFTEQIGW